MRLLDLFSGIGGFSLGLHRAGFHTAAFCEIDAYCQAVLASRFPGVPIYDDIRQLSAERLRGDGIDVDAICGGFPCQDLSFAGKRAGIAGSRSGLWGEYARLIRELRPRVVIVENVPGLLSAGMGRVLGDLAALGYDAEWDCIPASAVGAPHRRDRVWIVAHPQSQRRGEARGDFERSATRLTSGGEVLADASRERVEGDGAGRQQEPHSQAEKGLSRRDGSQLRDATGAGLSNGADRKMGESGAQPELERSSRRQPECGLGRVAHGVSDWVDSGAWLQEPEGVPRVIKGQENRASRLKALGNSIVPQIPAILGRAIMRAITA